MEICDKIYDKDALIYGIVIGKSGKYFKVLWDNDVLGNVEDNQEEVKIIEHGNIKMFKIIDILHTGYHGKEFESKVGEKYDNRRGKIMILDENSLKPGFGLRYELFDEEEAKKVNDEHAEEITCSCIYTTNFEKMYEENGFTMLRTLNSIYKLEKFG